MDTGDNIKASRANWSFTKDVASSFDTHISKSVPFYDEGHDLICYLTDYFCHNASICYDLGTATGSLIRKLAHHNSHKPGISWIGIDNEPEMIQYAKDKCRDFNNIEFVCEDMLLHDFKPSDFIVSYLTIHFTPERHRQTIFNKIYSALNWGGGFVLFEKVRAPDARFQDMMTALYNDLKLRNGFTVEEIENKAKSLRGVLNPFSTQANLDLLKRAGFVDVMTIMKYVSFECFLAIK